MAVLQDLTQLRAQNAALMAQIERLKALGQCKASMKVSDKGALSVYGLGRFPVTLYRGQWEKLLGMKDDIEAFILANSATLSVKE